MSHLNSHCLRCFNVTSRSWSTLPDYPVTIAGGVAIEVPDTIQYTFSPPTTQALPPPTTQSPSPPTTQTPAPSATQAPPPPTTQSPSPPTTQSPTPSMSRATSQALQTSAISQAVPSAQASQPQTSSAQAGFMTLPVNFFREHKMSRTLALHCVH